MPLPTLLTAGNLMPTLPADDPKYKETKKELDKLIPIDYVIKWFKNRYPGIGRPDNDKPTMADRVLILRSKTGSGKSSALPPMLYKNFIYGTANEKHAPIVLCTQPRRVTAKELATEAATKSYFVPLELGVNVGYQTGVITQKAKYGLTYATIGILLQQLKMRDDELILRKYRFIVLDEVHERSVDMDQVFYLLAAFMRRVLPNPRAPFIVMTSATFDPELFARFFGVYLEKPIMIEAGIFGQPNIIDVEGFAYPVQYNWLSRTSSNYLADITRIVEEIHTKNTDDKPTMCDILIFVPGIANMDAIIQQIKKKELAGLLVLKLEGGVVADKGRDYVLTMATPDKLPAGITRRLIISTNVAETGLTIETLKYVIDYGFNKATEYNPDCCIEELIEKPAPQSRIQQRRGRVGRKAPGVFYPLYTEETFNALPKLQLPAILENDFTDMLLNIAAINSADGFNIIDDVLNKMLEPPSGQALCNAVTKLVLMGLIAPANSADFQITKLGDIASRFSMIRPETARMILNGYCDYPEMPGRAIKPRVAIKDLITIAGIIENGGDLLKKMDENKINKLLSIGVPATFSADKSLAEIWKLTQNELMIELFVFNALIVALNNGEVPHDWAEENNINIGTYSSIAQTRNEIMENMINIGFDVNYNAEYSINSSAANPAEIIDGIKRAIHAGYLANTLVSTDTTKSKYTHELIHSVSAGVESFRFRPAEPIDDIIKSIGYPERVIAIEFGLAQTFGKNVGFNEYMPVIKKIVVL